MAESRLLQLGKYWHLFTCLALLCVTRTKGLYVPITYVTSGVAKGAVCLDGSPPAYNFDKGYGTGINSWLVQLEGGGWCHNVSSCLARSSTSLGSSMKMGNQLAFSGIMSNRRGFNPDFYNWNRVKVRYCDGSSFTGDVQAVDPVTNLHYRGARVWLAVMVDLLAKGMKNAENALLSGCSAGGLASILHCDSFKALLPMGAKVKCLSDAGYFINVKDILGASYIQTYFNEVVTLHGSAKNLPLSCRGRLNPSLCFFPQNVVQEVRTPVFLLNAAYDSWQIKNILAPTDADPGGSWNTCKMDINNCSPPQIKTMQGVTEKDAFHHCCLFFCSHHCFVALTSVLGLPFISTAFRMQFLRTLPRSSNSTARGLYINSCYAHCQTEFQESWYMADSPVLGRTKIAKAVGDWLYDRKSFQVIDCPYPCNPTCRGSAGGGGGGGEVGGDKCKKASEWQLVWIQCVHLI